MDPIVQILITIIGSGAIFSFLQFLITRHDNKSDKIEEIYDKINEGLSKQEQITKEIQESLQEELRDGLTEREETGRARYEEHQQAIRKLNEAILQLTKNDTEQSQYIKYIGEELMGLAHDKLVYLTDHFQARGAITLKEKATLEAIYKPYHEGLGGNGDGKTGYEYSMQLPVVTDIKAAEMDRKLKLNKYCGEE